MEVAKKSLSFEYQVKALISQPLSIHLSGKIHASHLLCLVRRTLFLLTIRHKSAVLRLHSLLSSNSPEATIHLVDWIEVLYAGFVII